MYIRYTVNSVPKYSAWSLVDKYVVSKYLLMSECLGLLVLLKTMKRLLLSRV